MTDEPQPESHGTVSQGGYLVPTLDEAVHEPRVRPGVIRWVLYALGLGLPDRHRTWVLHDTICSTWIVRHIVRSLLIVAIPVVAVVLFLPTHLGLRILTAFVAGGCFLMFAMVHIIEITERRVVRAGYLGGTAERLRGERSISAQREANRLRRERAAIRRDRRQLRGR